MLISKFNAENVLDNILILEKEFNIRIPKQYRQFLIKYNGGLTPDTTFRLSKISSDIEGFMALSVKIRLLHRKYTT